MLNSFNHYSAENTSPEPVLLQELLDFTQKNVPGAQMLCGRVEGRFLKWLVQMTKTKNILELGTYTGYSALSMAEALPEDGKLITCDKNDQVLAIAEAFIKRSPYGYKIQVIPQECNQLLDELLIKQVKFDFIFIDANKKSNAEYIQKCLKLLSTDGIIAVDNTLFRGEVLNPQSEISKNIAEFNKNLVQRRDIEVLLLPVRDGLTLIKKVGVENERTST